MQIGKAAVEQDKMPNRANYEITDILLPLVQEALNHAGLSGYQVIVNDGDGHFPDDALNDELSFMGPDGKKIGISIQSGPYGCSVNTYLYDEAGAVTGVRYGASKGYAQLSELARDAATALLAEREEKAVASPSP